MLFLNLYAHITNYTIFFQFCFTLCENYIFASLNTSTIDGYVFCKNGGKLDFATHAALEMSSSF